MIDDNDIYKSKKMFKKRKQLDELFEEFENEQYNFINKIIEKYNIQTKNDFREYYHLFPESTAKFDTLIRFSKKDKELQL